MRSSQILLSLVLTLSASSVLMAQAQQPAPAPMSIYTGSFGGGLALTGGNTDTKSFNFTFNLVRDPKTKNVFKADALYLRSSQNDVLTLHRSSLRLRVDGFIAANELDRVHLIAHSMGGLDARYLISKLGYLSNGIAASDYRPTNQHGEVQQILGAVVLAALREALVVLVHPVALLTEADRIAHRGGGQRIVGVLLERHLVGTNGERALRDHDIADERAGLRLDVDVAGIRGIVDRLVAIGGGGVRERRRGGQRQGEGGNDDTAQHDCRISHFGDSGWKLPRTPDLTFAVRV